ncbi:unnamed protein product [Kuraishia capsulata CBS 1993]|uniref:Vesicular-fusion protein SEC18 n=1 Tax=Kuraishia capsulata CBS 1993 TaxID=1382522 RepID=W6MFK9_9ASCO|nr:uncharacterized protein KUCA_T00000353001 [Kuraishia capsulata CBS 1993]CDK24391.1 unnamed protein product [Kuraishia capsulata CBS 1993]
MEKLGFGRPGRSSHNKVFYAKNSPSNAIALTNCLAFNPQDFKDNEYVICDGRYVFSTKTSTDVLPGTFGASGNQRFWAGWSVDQAVNVEHFDLFKNTGKKAYLGTMNLEISFRNRQRANSTEFDQDELARAFVDRFESQVFQPTQIILFEFKGVIFELVIKSIQVVDLGVVDIADLPSSTSIAKKGILVSQTRLNFFKGPDGMVNLKASSTRPNADAIIRPDFKFEDMGIGGLDKEFTSIFRRAFASRIFPPGLIEKLGIQHVKGLLLYGPPGTGKTLIARKIGTMLNAKEPKIVNGPEILSKYVGSSEENIRNLFKDAETEYKAKGDASSLHIIIFDELDSIFKQRGSRGDGTGVADNVVNQLLSKMDGVDQLNNILVIGMTNRRDLIDEALLRPGRFEVQVEIHLPDEPGRKQIFEIKTKKMRENGSLGRDVNIAELAAMSKNFSGAEIEGLIKSASSFALNQHIKVGTVGDIAGDLANMVVSRSDFIHALEEVKPAFGVHEEDLQECTKGGVLKYSSAIDDILNRGTRAIKQARESDRFNFSSILMHGPPGSGKTALAAAIGLASEFPFIRLISPDAMVGMSEAAKVQFIDNTFRDAYKSPLNVLVVDDIEGLIDYVPIGPRFASTVLRALMVRLKKSPPEGHRLIVISTTSSYTVLRQLDMLGCFNDEIGVPNLGSLDEFARVLEATRFSDAAGRKQVLQSLASVVSEVNVPIKKTLFNIDTARFGENPVQDLVELMVESTTPLRR